MLNPFGIEIPRKGRFLHTYGILTLDAIVIHVYNNNNISFIPGESF